MTDTTSDDMNYLERAEHYREDVHDELTDTYDYLLGRGCEPRLAAGTLHYLAGQLGYGESRTQADLGEAYDMSERTISQWAEKAWQGHLEADWDTLAPRRLGPTGRAIYHALHHAESPLTTSDLNARLNRTYRQIGVVLRGLAKAGVIDCQRVSGGELEWWAVSQEDTPGQEDLE